MAVLKKSIDKWMTNAYLSPWLNYIQKKKNRGELALVDNVWVDIPNIINKPFTCETELCSKGLRKKGKWSCCAELSAEITSKEKKRLKPVFKEISKFLSENDTAWKKKPHTFNDCFTTDSENPFQMELAKREKRCVFSFITKTGKIQCGIHGWGLQNKKDIFYYKPKLCFLFPMILHEISEGLYLLSSIDKENAPLIGYNSYKELVCLQGKKTFDKLGGFNGSHFYEDFKGTITHIFGIRFFDKLDKFAKKSTTRSTGKFIEIKSKKTKGDVIRH